MHKFKIKRKIINFLKKLEMKEFFLRFLSTTLGLSAGGIIVSEYFFYKLDLRLKDLKQHSKELLSNQKEELIERVKQYPSNLVSNTKDAFLSKIQRQKE